MLSSLMILVALSSVTSASYGHPCSHYDRSEFRRYTELVREDSSDVRHLGDMVEAWDRICERERRNIDKKSVTEISSLLSNQTNTSIVLYMLLSIDKNLKYARDDVNSAYKRVEKEQADKPMPVGILNHSVLYAFKCIENKIETGNEIEKYCSRLRRVRP